MIGALLDHLRTRAMADWRVAFAVTLGLVIAATLLRLALQPLFGPDHAFIGFYPAVILATFVAGRRAGLLATAVSAVGAWWLFEPPRFTFDVTAHAITAPLFFALNAMLGVYLIAGLSEALVTVARERSRAEAAAQHNADVFCELNKQVAHHLQLVAGVLALQAQGEPEARVAGALAKASETSLLLARAHRDCAGQTAETIDFPSFARRIVEAKLASRGLGAEMIVLAGDELSLPTDQAASLGAALLECLDVVLGRGARARLELRLVRQDEGVLVRMAELEDLSGAALASLAEGYLLRAVIEQLGARLRFASSAAGGALEILFRPDGFTPVPEPERMTLH